MATIQITEDWRVQSEPHSFALAKRQVVKNKDTGKPEEKWVAKSWHTSPEEAGGYWVAEQARMAETHGFEQLQAERVRLKSVLARAGLLA